MKKIFNKKLFCIIFILLIIISGSLYYWLIREEVIVYTNEAIEEIESKTDSIIIEMDNMKDNDVVLKIGEESILKIDIEIVKTYNEENKIDDNPIIEVAKKMVSVQEARKLGKELSEETRREYKKGYKEIYESTDTTLSEEEYVNDRMRYSENSDLATEFYYYIGNLITSKELICDDEIINQKLKKYYDFTEKYRDKEDIKLFDIVSQQGVKLLREIKNDYLGYLLLQYDIEYEI